MREITDASFQADVLKAGKPVVVDFWAPWCGPCKAVAPILESLAADHAGRVEFAKINIDDNPEAASRYDVLSIPTTILFEGGQPRQTVIGARPRSYYEQAFEDWLN